MNVLVLGASGGVGRQLVAMGQTRGHQVTALIRPQTAVEPPQGVLTIRGEALDPEVLRAALSGQDAVLCAVGMVRENPANPWSRSLSPPDLTSQLAQRLVAAMGDAGVKRVVAVSAAGVGDSAAGLNLPMRLFLATTMIGTAYRDLAVMEEVFRASPVDWLAPRPTRLTDGPFTGQVKVVPAFGLSAAISRADVAGFMLDALARLDTPDPDWGGRTPQISGP